MHEAILGNCTSKQLDCSVIRVRDAAPYIGVCSTRLWQLSKTPDFPRPIVLGQRARGYRRADLDSWIESRKAA